jgi:hypothetical protein
MSLWLEVRVMEMSLAIVRFAVGKSCTGNNVISEWEATRNDSCDLSSG